VSKLAAAETVLFGVFHKGKQRDGDNNSHIDYMRVQAVFSRPGGPQNRLNPTKRSLLAAKRGI
jgi:hypothetical protein